MTRLCKQTDRLPIVQIGDDGLCQCSKCETLNTIQGVKIYRFRGQYLCQKCVSEEFAKTEYLHHFAA